jgi:hypothetical protein
MLQSHLPCPGPDESDHDPHSFIRVCRALTLTQRWTTSKINCCSLYAVNSREISDSSEATFDVTLRWPAWHVALLDHPFQVPTEAACVITPISPHTACLESPLSLPPTLPRLPRLTKKNQTKIDKIYHLRRNDSLELSLRDTSLLSSSFPPPTFTSSFNCITYFTFFFVEL